MTFGFVLSTLLTPMAAMGVPRGDVMIALVFAGAAVAWMAATGIQPGDIMIALAFAATVVVVAALTFGGGGVGAWRELGLIKLCKYAGEFGFIKYELKSDYF